MHGCLLKGGMGVQVLSIIKRGHKKFEEICVDCLVRAKELNYSFVDINLTLEFISDLPIILSKTGSGLTPFSSNQK